MAGDYICFPDNVDMVRYWSRLGFLLEKRVEGTQRFVEVERTLKRPFYPSTQADVAVETAAAANAANAPGTRNDR
jgi:hypothetical protein